MSRPKYKDWITPEGLQQITEWGRLGLSNNQIANNIGINEATLYRWLDRYKDIEQALETGRYQPVKELENALYKKAVGFYENGKYYPPDNNAIMFLLKNWDNRRYKEKHLSKAEQLKLETEIKSAELDNEIKEFKIKQLEQLLSSNNPTIEKIEKFIYLLKSDSEQG